jgi:hypothetical protein
MAADNEHPAPEQPEGTAPPEGTGAFVAQIEIGVDWDKNMVIFSQKPTGPLVGTPMVMAMAVDAFLSTAFNLALQQIDRKQEGQRSGILRVAMQSKRFRK